VDGVRDNIEAKRHFNRSNFMRKEVAAMEYKLVVVYFRYGSRWTGSKMVLPLLNKEALGGKVQPPKSTTKSRVANNRMVDIGCFNLNLYLSN
jgi:hypothetical protein